MKWYDMIWYDSVWYDKIWCDMRWYEMIWDDMIWYDLKWYDMLWYMVLYDMISALISNSYVVRYDVTDNSCKNFKNQYRVWPSEATTFILRMVLCLKWPQKTLKKSKCLVNS